MGKRMTTDNGLVLHVSENLNEEIDGVEITLPAADYRAVATGLVASEGEDDVAQYLLLPIGRERVHPISADGLTQLSGHDQVEVTDAE